MAHYESAIAEKGQSVLCKLPSPRHRRLQLTLKMQMQIEPIRQVTVPQMSLHGPMKKKQPSDESWTESLCL